MRTPQSRIYPSLAIAAAIASAAVLGWPQSQSVLAQNNGKKIDEQQWTIAAPGLVEPNDGEIGLGVEIVGRVVSIPVALRDKIRAGQVLLRLDDADAIARIQSTGAEVEIHERSRDNVAATRRGRSRRSAADKLADAEVALFSARRELDRLDERADDKKATVKELEDALKAIDTAIAARNTARKELDDINAAEATPLYSRSEASLELARANYTLALQAFEKTRIRAGIDGTVLRINARRGEVVSPQLPRPLLVIGDISKLKVRAEVDERSVADVKVGQKAVIRSVAFEGQDFNATVSEISAALGPGRIGKRQNRGPSNANVLEVILEVDTGTPLLSGMEVDVLFEGRDGEKKAKNNRKKEATATN